MEPQYENPFDTEREAPKQARGRAFLNPYLSEQRRRARGSLAQSSRGYAPNAGAPTPYFILDIGPPGGQPDSDLRRFERHEAAYRAGLARLQRELAGENWQTDNREYARAIEAHWTRRHRHELAEINCEKGRAAFRAHRKSIMLGGELHCARPVKRDSAPGAGGGRNFPDWCTNRPAKLP